MKVVLSRLPLLGAGPLPRREDKKTSGVDTENKLNNVYGTRYRIRLDHQILTDRGVLYPQAL